MTAMAYRLGIDVGGTFTDFVLMSPDGQTSVHKTPSTPADPSAAVLNGLAEMAAQRGMKPEEFIAQVESILHGTTVATNAVLTGSGSPTALLTTAGLRDVLEMRRGYREELFNNRLAPPEPLVPRERRFAITERVNHAGEVLTPLDEQQLLRTVEGLRNQPIEAIAICFMHSYANPDHEERAAEIVAKLLPDVYCTTSSRLLPQIRLYDRISTTALNAYVGPVLSRYLSNLTRRLDELRFGGVLLIMASNGGMISPEVAASQAAATLLSGPAAGPIGGVAVSGAQGFDDCITMDMGGTSFDVALVQNRAPLVSNESWVARHRLALPSLDIHSIGSGGGSIGWIDDGGLLRVGPKSAGAEPGPACYGRGGTLPTCTDADLILGYLNPDFFLGGRIRLDVRAAEAAIAEHIARPLGLGLVEAAAGINRVSNVNMATGLREISVRRGIDPRNLPMVVAGGAGPVHAGTIAAELGIQIVLIPRESSVFCANGMLHSDLKHDFVRTYHVYLRQADVDQIIALLTEMAEAGRDVLRRERIEPENIHVAYAADLRYLKQHHEITLPLDPTVLRRNPQALAAAFHQRHEELFGYSLAASNSEIELVNLRVSCTGRTPKPEVRRLAYEGSDASNLIKGERPIWDHEAGQFVTVPVYEGERMGYGRRCQGPAIVELSHTTIVIPAGYHLVVDASGTFSLYHRSVETEYLERVLS